MIRRYTIIVIVVTLVLLLAPEVKAVNAETLFTMIP